MGNKSGKPKKKDGTEEGDSTKVNGEAGQAENKTEEGGDTKPEVSLIRYILQRREHKFLHVREAGQAEHKTWIQNLDMIRYKSRNLIRVICPLPLLF